MAWVLGGSLRTASKPLRCSHKNLLTMRASDQKVGRSPCNRWWLHCLTQLRLITCRLGLFPTLDIQLSVGNQSLFRARGNRSRNKFLNLDADSGITLYQIPEYSDMFGKPEPGTNSICLLLNLELFTTSSCKLPSPLFLPPQGLAAANQHASQGRAATRLQDCYEHTTCVSSNSPESFISIGIPGEFLQFIIHVWFLFFSPVWNSSLHSKF